MKKEKSTSTRKLTILMIVMVLGLLLISTAQISEPIRKFLEVVVIVLGYAAVGAWLCVSAPSLESETGHRRNEKYQRGQPSQTQAALNGQQRHYPVVMNRDGKPQHSTKEHET